MTRTILSIDGGGIRGIIPARIIGEIESRTGKPAASLFDLLAGTSTGGIIALALATPEGKGNAAPRYSGHELVTLYEDFGREIFSASLWHVLTSVGSLKGPKYEAQGIEKVLNEYFGEARLSEALTNVLVTAYNTAGPAPAFFKSWRAKTDKNYDYRLREIARATSAAPTFFPPLRLPDIRPGEPEMCLIDGAVFANNPAMCAWAEAPALFEGVGDFIVVSVGTGNDEDKIAYEAAKGWGVALWARPLVKILLDGVSDTVDYQLKQRLHPKLGRRYYRLQGDLGSHAAMDDASESNVQALLGIAEDILAREAKTLDEICKDLTGAFPGRQRRVAA